MQKVHVTMLVYAPDHVSDMYEEIERSIEVGLRMVGEGFYLMKVLKAKVQHTIPRAGTKPKSWKEYRIRNRDWWDNHLNERERQKLLASGLTEPLLCNCGQCGRMHDSDCSVHSEPAMPKGQCDCGDRDNEL